MSWFERIVPFAVERIPADVQLFHLFIGHLDARQILAVIQSGLDSQSSFGGGRPIRDDHPIVAQRRPCQLCVI